MILGASSGHGRDHYAGLATILLVTNGAHPYVEYVKVGPRKQRKYTINESSDMFVPEPRACIQKSCCVNTGGGKLKVEQAVELRKHSRNKCTLEQQNMQGDVGKNLSAFGTE